MNTLQHLLYVVLLLIVSNNSLTATNYFIENNLEQAKRQARQEGKLIMVDFWAEWCNPCQWMDEQTFSSPEVANYLSANYVSVRIDIDNLEGYGYKEEYNIRYLPSILILDAEGTVIKKYEESFAPSKLIQLLKSHNAGSANRPQYASSAPSNYRPAAPVSESTPQAKPAPTWTPALSSDYATNNTATEQYEGRPSQTTGTYTETSNYAQESPTANYNANTAMEQYEGRPSQTTSTYTETSNYTQESPTVNYTAPASSPYTAATTASTTSYQSSTTGNSYNTTNSLTNSLTTGLYQFNVHPAPTNGYSVQVGAYYEYGNVLTEVAAFQEQYKDMILVHISELNGMPCYKILLGHFGTYESANEHKALLKTKGLDCFIKELATMGQTMQ